MSSFNHRIIRIIRFFITGLQPVHRFHPGSWAAPAPHPRNNHGPIYTTRCQSSLQRAASGVTEPGPVWCATAPVRCRPHLATGPAQLSRFISTITAVQSYSTEPVYVASSSSAAVSQHPGVPTDATAPCNLDSSYSHSRSAVDTEGSTVTHPRLITSHGQWQWLWHP